MIKFLTAASMTACLLALLLHTPKTIQSAPQPEVASSTILLIGPLNLGDLFDNMDEKEKFREGIPKGGGPSCDDMTKAFRECRLCIIDKRVPSKENDKGLTFESREEGYPKLVVEGKLSFEFSRKDKPDFKVNLKSVELRGTTTYIGEQEYRSSRILVELETSPYGDEKIQYRGLNFESRRLWYDSTGKILSSDPTKKK